MFQSALYPKPISFRIYHHSRQKNWYESSNKAGASIGVPYKSSEQHAKVCLHYQTPASHRLQGSRRARKLLNTNTCNVRRFASLACRDFTYIEVISPCWSCHSAFEASARMNDGEGYKLGRLLISLDHLLSSKSHHLYTPRFLLSTKLAQHYFAKTIYHHHQSRPRIPKTHTD